MVGAAKMRNVLVKSPKLQPRFRIDQNKNFNFVRPGTVKDETSQRMTPTDLPAPVVPAISRVGIFREISDIVESIYGLAERDGSVSMPTRETRATQSPRAGNCSRRGLGTSMPT